MNKSDLIDKLCCKHTHLTSQDVESSVKIILSYMTDTLTSGERIEIRGFGSFSLHYTEARIGRNPRTGEAVSLSEKYRPHFKPGKDLKDRVNDAV